MTASWIIQTLIMLALGVIGYFLKDMKSSFEKQLNSQSERMQGMEVRMDDKLDAFKEEVKRNNQSLEIRLDKRITSTEERYEALCRDLNNYKDQIHKDYTLKDDFIRAVSTIERKLDKITELITERRPT
ncbi:MAG TPA: hypothetical protein VN426_06210 [Syntrophomonadaceae bacterium]|nr:hypothetical protein [Syntrophomonadaceae bacterium]